MFSLFLLVTSPSPKYSVSVVVINIVSLLLAFSCTLVTYLSNPFFDLVNFRKLVDDLMASSTTRKICYDAQKIVRHLIETEEYDVRKGDLTN